MTKNPSNTFGAEVNVINDGKLQYLSDGKLQKTKIQMGPGFLPNGEPQSFYNDAGVFKGMTVILQERGLVEESKLLAQCDRFKCEGSARCCQRRVLWNQPDFRDHKSALEIFFRERGVELLFLPKFHPELTFIERCWGQAKRVYREYPRSSRVDKLETNVLTALGSVSMEVMRRWVFQLSYHN